MWPKFCSFEKLEIENLRFCPHKQLQHFWTEKKLVLNSLEYSWFMYFSPIYKKNKNWKQTLLLDFEYISIFTAFAVSLFWSQSRIFCGKHKQVKGLSFQKLSAHFFSTFHYLGQSWKQNLIWSYGSFSVNELTVMTSK